MSIKSLIREEVGLLLEKRVAQISANITISMDVQDTQHSKSRMFRHKDKGVIIINSDIRELVESVKDDISFHIIHGDIINNSEFIITGSEGKKISLVILAEEISPYMWTLVIKTVWSEKGEGRPFLIGRDQLQIRA